MTDVATQYRAVRENIGLIDRSDVGKIAISGADRFSWLQGMVSNDARLLERGGARSLQACVLDATGHILSDMTLIHFDLTYLLDEAHDLPESDFILAALPRANVQKVLGIFDRLLIMEDVEVQDVSDGLDCYSLQGPDARALVTPDGEQNSLPLDKHPFWNHQVVFAADHTGSGGFDWYFLSPPTAYIEEFCTEEQFIAVGTEAQEILRVEAGLPKYGVDMDETTLAPEAGLMPTHISLTKGCYVGQEIVARIDSRGHTNRALTGLAFAEGDIPAPGDKVFVAENGGMRETGRITSVVAASPARNGRPIALGYARHEHRAPGSRLEVPGTEKTHIAEVVALPFYLLPTA